MASVFFNSLPLIGVRFLLYCCSWFWCFCKKQQNLAEKRFFHRNAVLVSTQQPSNLGGAGFDNWIFGMLRSTLMPALRNFVLFSSKAIMENTFVLGRLELQVSNAPWHAKWLTMHDMNDNILLAHACKNEYLNSMPLLLPYSICLFFARKMVLEWTLLPAVEPYITIVSAC